MLFCKGIKIGGLEVRVILDLVYDRFDFGDFEETFQVFDAEIRHADGFDKSLVDEGFEGFPCVFKRNTV